MNKKLKICISVIFSLVLIIICGVNIYIKRNSTEYLLTQSLKEKVQNKGQLDYDQFQEYKQKNIDKMNSGEELSAEDYFFISYGYYLDKNMEEVNEYSNTAKLKKDEFKDDFVKTYNEFLIAYSDLYLGNEDETIEIVKKFMRKIQLKIGIKIINYCIHFLHWL
ncbi:hypothetical protein [uncultured Clostridium sp.]|uniref:hypothetical protein n=1 Tax=uncultured Clostridium sp. TaxID=59620 RepID=UPI0025F62723|nr:hypothetical protein [uncultured Clostridium sp.]